MVFDPEYVKHVAKSCISCGNCVNKCLMLQACAIEPKSYFNAYVTSPKKQKNNLLAYNCLFCGLCKTVCPKGLNLGEAFLVIRAEMVRSSRGRIPIKALRTVNTHQSLSFSRLFTTLNPGNRGDS